VVNAQLEAADAQPLGDEHFELDSALVDSEKLVYKHPLEAAK